MMFPLILLQAKAVREIQLDFDHYGSNVSINSPSGEGGEKAFTVPQLIDELSFH